MTRYLQFAGPCRCCGRPRVELVLCTCGHTVTRHRIDLKFQRCDVDGCKCRQVLEAPGQEDFDAA